jgi:hypothetical protein
MAQKKCRKQIDFSWMKGKLRKELKKITESLQAGGKITAAEFVRLVEYQREVCGVPEPPVPEVFWYDDFNARK